MSGLLPAALFGCAATLCPGYAVVAENLSLGVQRQTSPHLYEHAGGRKVNPTPNTKLFVFMDKQAGEFGGWICSGTSPRKFSLAERRVYPARNSLDPSSLEARPYIPRADRFSW